MHFVLRFFEVELNSRSPASTPTIAPPLVPPNSAEVYIQSARRGQATERRSRAAAILRRGADDAGGRGEARRVGRVDGGVVRGMTFGAQWRGVSGPGWRPTRASAV